MALEPRNFLVLGEGDAVEGADLVVGVDGVAGDGGRAILEGVLEGVVGSGRAMGTTMGVTGVSRSTIRVSMRANDRRREGLTLVLGTNGILRRTLLHTLDDSR